MKLSLKRAGGLTGAVAATAGALVVASSGLDYAAASTIPRGELQICAQGDYSAFIWQRPMNATSRGVASEPETPGHPHDCWLQPVDTGGQWSQVDVIGVRPDGSQFSLGSQWYNSSVSGLGIGAEGSWSAGPYVWTW
jgi:hypothetical protein